METQSFLIKNKVTRTWFSVIFKSLLAATLSTSCFRPAHKSPDANSLDAQEETLATFTLKESTASFEEQEIDQEF